MLDVLESFLNIHAHTYMRLDGSTKPEQRQVLMQVGRQAGRASFWHT
jgi:E1A-binding protein p400